jgi:hypothetical protein
MKRIFLSMVTIGASLLLSDTAMAQRNCGIMEYHEQHVLEYPQAAENLEAIEEFTQRFVERGGELTDRNAITIPVVVHVVYRTTAENISEAQILSQINVLNADFRKLNADASLIPSQFTGLAADAQIQFCLASVDPSGNPTTGIIRRATTVTSFSTNNSVKYTANGGSNAWPADRYLNIWVCNLSGGVLGYAQFPGGATATDGVVCTYTAFGTTGSAAAPFNKGRTATHEVGHWLNLRHIWGDATCGSDQVNDTPTHNTANYGCPSFPHYSTCSGSPLEMTMNYMDYTDDACMYMFSAGQSSRMNALFAPGGARYSLLSSNGCGGSGGGDPNPVVCAVPTGLTSGSITSSSAVISWAAVSGAVSYDVQYRVAGGTWSQGNVTGTSANFTGLLAGTTYEWAVRTNCTGSSSAFSATSTFATSAAVSCTNDAYESNETLATAKTLAVNTTFSAMKICPNDVDWFKFSSSSSQRKVRVRIYNLPADYDLELYSSNGTLLGTSANGGTTNEGVFFNASGTGTYYVKVFGYNGASSNSAYTIRCERQKKNYTSAGRLDGEENEELLSESFGFTAFPNPVTDNLTLQLAGGLSDLVLVNIYDMSGRMVLSTTSPYGEDGVTVNMSTADLRSGLYLIEAIAGEERVTQRIVKD